MQALPYDTLMGWIASIVLALVFARGAWHKLSDLPMTQAIVDGYDLAPSRLVPVIAPLLGVVEAIVAVALLMPATRAGSAPPAALLLALYAVAIAINIRRGRYEIDCGCGGSGEGLSWLLVARNSALIALAVPVVLAPSAAPFGALDLAVLAFSVAGLWLVLLAVEQAGANNAARRQLIDVFRRSA